MHLEILGLILRFMFQTNCPKFGFLIVQKSLQIEKCEIG